MVVSGREQAREYARINAYAAKLWGAFLPGALTLVLQAKGKKIEGITRDDHTVAIRRVNVPVISQLLRKIGQPLTITSANRSGKPDVFDLKDFLRQYKGKALPDVFINAGRLPKRRLSTVVGVKKGVIIHRLGAISEKAIERIMTKRV